MRSLAFLDDANKWRRDQPDRVVGRERHVDRRRSAQAHIWPERMHPLGGTMTCDLGDIRGTPTFRPRWHEPNSRIEDSGGARYHFSLEHLDLYHGVRRQNAAVGEE